MKRICSVIAIICIATCATASVPGWVGRDNWTQLRDNHSADGRNSAIPDKTPSAGEIAALIRQLKPYKPSKPAWLVPDRPELRLAARCALKLAGAAAVPALKAEIDKQGPASEACKQILDNIAKPEILWKFKAESFFTGSPAYDYKAVYAADRGGNVYAVDRLTGEKRWQAKLTALTNCTPLVGSRHLYVGAHDGTMAKVHKSDGEILWTFKRNDVAEGTDVFIWDGASSNGDNIYFATADGKVFALRQSDGEKIWEFTVDPADAKTKLPGIFYGIPAWSYWKLYIAGSNGKVYCLDAKTGTQIWKADAPVGIAKSVAVGKGLVFTGAGKDFIALDMKTGEQKWSFKTMRRISSAPTVYGDHVVIGGRHGMTHKLEAATGELIWTGKVNGEVTGSLAIVNDRIYSNSAMNVSCSNLNTIGSIWNYRPLEAFPVKAPSPVVNGGIVYITTPMTSRPERRPNELELSNSIIAILGVSDNLYGLNPQPIPYGLDEVHRRVVARSNKPYPLLKDADGVMQSEQLIFHDPRTGSEITKFTDDAAANPHSIFINRPAYNSNGAKLIFRSTRAGGPGRYVLNSDGTGYQWVKVANPILNYMIGPIWDRKEAHITYTNTRDTLYKLDVDTFELTKVCDLPDPERSKGIWSSSADGELLLLYSKQKAYLARTDGGGVKTIDLGNKPNVMELAPKHKRDIEKSGVHEMLFMMNPANTFMFNYGPASSVGEGIFFEMDTDGNLLRKIYPYYEQGHRERIYYSHTGWSHDGSKVAYYGYGGPQVGYGLIMRDADGSNPVLLCKTGGGGHTGWDNYDNDWMFASTSRGKSKYAGTILRCRTDGSQTAHILCDARTKTKINGAYSAIPRVSPSPDGTKAVFSNAMLGTSIFHDTYSVAAKRPDPPVNVRAEGKTIRWDPPRLNREIKGYNVYRSTDGREWDLMTPECVRGTQFQVDKDGVYLVTSLEWSNQESLAPSGPVTFGENAQPVIMLEAEFGEYEMPMRELRDMNAANWHAVENTSDTAKGMPPGENRLIPLKLTFDCPVRGDYAIYARIRDGAWGMYVNGKREGVSWEPGEQWKWRQFNRNSHLKAGQNTLTFYASGQGAAIDKVIISPDSGLKLKGPMYIDTTAPKLAGELTAERLDNVNVKLNWKASKDADLRYYNVYYSSTGAPEIVQASRIASPPAGASQYIDFATKPGADAYYAVTAVDRFDNESPPITATAPVAE